MDGRPFEREAQSADDPYPDYAWLGNDTDSKNRSRSRSPWIVAGLVCLVLLSAAAAWALSRSSYWPTGCGVGGHAEWCAEPSGEMTDPALVDVVHDYCPALSPTAQEDVAPQPLSQLGLADDETFARTSGSPERGSEDALLGRPGAIAWVTRWQDGLVEIRCPGSSATTPSLRLAPDQFRSTIAAAEASAGRHVDFATVARQLIAPGTPQGSPGMSYGFLTCDTGDVDLGAPEAGDAFSCSLEVFGPEGQGTYRGSFVITDDQPYFEPEEFNRD